MNLTLVTTRRLSYNEEYYHSLSYNLSAVFCRWVISRDIPRTDRTFLSASFQRDEVMIKHVCPSGEGEGSHISQRIPRFKDFLQRFFLVNRYFQREQGGTGLTNNLVNRFIDEDRCKRIHIFHSVIPADDKYQIIGRFRQ